VCRRIIPACVLVRPLDAKLGTFVVYHRIWLVLELSISSPRISSLVVVLRVEEPVSVVPVLVSFTVPIIRSGRIVKVDVAIHAHDKRL